MIYIVFNNNQKWHSNAKEIKILLLILRETFNFYEKLKKIYWKYVKNRFYIFYVIFEKKNSWIDLKCSIATVIGYFEEICVIKHADSNQTWLFEKIIYFIVIQ